jgi:NAD-dependent dihydropyrimidine dehydrogenase PreA subunit
MRNIVNTPGDNNMTDKAYMVPNPPTPNKAVEYNPAICIGCNKCVDVCPDDVLMPNPEKKKEPIVVYPEECWYCGACVEECPQTGAIKMLHPTQQRISVNWKRKNTGELFRLGMKNPPPPNTKPPSGGV